MRLILLTRKERIKAVFNCMWFGIMPSWVYEKECHYVGHFNYFSHLIHNFNIAKLLVLKKELENHHTFYKSKVKYFR